MNDVEEKWREIPGYPKYWASNAGNIRVNRGTKFYNMKGCPDKDGYIKHTLKVDGQVIYRRRAPLVAMTWIGPRPEGLVVCHKNGINTDDRPDNLEYKSQRENIHDKFIHGTIANGIKNGNAVINEDIARDIYLSKESMKNLMKRYNISSIVVYSIWNNLTWRHITDKLPTRIKKKYERTSIYKGVSLRKDGRILVQKHINGKNKVFYGFETEEDAYSFYLAL